MKKLIFTGIAVLAASLLLTCENGFSIIEKIETEVKVSNDKFLVIKSITPADELTGVDPGTDITITFDRILNMNTVNSNSIIITDNAGNEKPWFNPVFENLTKTLTIETYGLDITTKHIISIDGLKGSDNSELQANYIWSFTTGIAPAGSLILSSNNAASTDGFTDDGEVTVELSGNDVAEYYSINIVRSVLESPADIGIGDWNAIDGNDSIPNFALIGTEGENTVYVIFRYFNTTSSAYVYSQIKEAEIYLDLTDPVVNAGTNKLVNAQTFQSASVTEANVLSYQWSGTGLTFSSASAEDTYINATSDGQYTATLLVTDKSGRTGSDSLTFTKDTEDPVASFASINGGATLSTDSVVNFQFTFSDNRSSATSCQYRLYDSENYYHTWEDVTSSTMMVPVTFTGSYNYVKRNIYVQFLDEAGNDSNIDVEYGKSYDNIYIDNIPVTAPTVSTSALITLDQTPTWIWTTAGNGAGYYQYQLDGGGWQPVTTATSFTPVSQLSDGLHTLYVQERDFDYDYSSSGSRQLRVTEMIPYDGQTGVAPLRGVLTVRWREVDSRDTYTIQGFSGFKWITLGSGLTTNSYTLSGLPGGETYTWRVNVDPYIGINYYLPDTGGAVFTTK